MLLRLSYKNKITNLSFEICGEERWWKMCCWLRLSSSQLLWVKQDPGTRCCPEQEGEALLYKALDLTQGFILLHSVQWKRWHKPSLLTLFQFPSCALPAAAEMLQALQSSTWPCCHCTQGASLCPAILPAQRCPASGKAGEAKGQWCSSWAQNHTRGTISCRQVTGNTDCYLGQ